MINENFKTTFSYFVETINSINKIKDKSDFDKQSTYDVLKRITDSIIFITSKEEVFNENLNALLNELIEVQKDVQKLSVHFLNNSLTHRMTSLMQNLIIETEAVIDEREKIKKILEQTILNKQTFVFNEEIKDIVPKEKVKIFQSSFHNEIEKEMNEFLSSHNIEITRTLQDIKENNIFITIFYIDKP